MTKISKLRLSHLKVGVPKTIPVIWVSPDKVIGRFQQYDGLHVYLNATNAASYVLVNGALPAGITLFKNLLYGAFANDQETAQFTIRAIGADGSSHADRKFVIVVGQYPDPYWITPAGLLDDINVDTPISIPLLAKDQYDLPITYTLFGGSLPDGLTLDSNTGIIGGSVSGLTPLAPNGEYDFSVTASNGYSNVIRSFQLFVEGLDSKNIWITPAGPIGYGFGTGKFDTFVLAHDPANATVTYQKLAGDIPDYLEINANTGQISGTLAEVTDDLTYKVLMGAVTNTYVSRRMFSIQVKYDPIPYIDPINNNQNIGPGAIELNPYYSNSNVTIRPELIGNITVTAIGLPDFVTDFNTNAGIFTDDVSGNTVQLVSAYFSALPENATRTANTEYEYTLIVDDSIKQSQKSVLFTDYLDLPPVFQSGPNLLSAYGSNGANIVSGNTINPLAIDAYGRTVTYTLIANSYLYGMSFDSNTGQFSGILPDTRMRDIQINATVMANASALPSLSVLPGANAAIADFTLNIWKDVVPIFDTPEGVVGTVEENDIFEGIILAHDPHHIRTVTYRLVSSELDGYAAPGILLNNDGNLLGYSESISEPDQHVYNFVVEASYNGFMPATANFAIIVQKNVPPVWDTPTGAMANFAVLAMKKTTFTVTGHDPNGKSVSYTAGDNNLPSQIEFSQNAVKGRFPPVETSQSPIYYTFNQNHSPNIPKTISLTNQQSGTSIHVYDVMSSFVKVDSSNSFGLVSYNYMAVDINNNPYETSGILTNDGDTGYFIPVSYTHLTLPTNREV